MKYLKGIAHVAVLVLSVTGLSAYAQSAIWHRSSLAEYNNTVGKAHQPKGYFLFNHGYADATTFTPSTNWNVNDFTNAGIPFTANNQVLRQVNGYGSTAFQMGDGKAAYFLNSYRSSADPLNEVGLDMLNTDTKIDAAFGGDVNNITNNWSLSPSAQVCLSTVYTMNYWSGESDKAVQSYWSVFLLDTSLNKGFNLTIKLWANREEGKWEGSGGSEIGKYVYTGVWNGARFTTPQVHSNEAILGATATSNALGQNVWFHTCITRQNLANIIAEYNAGLSAADRISTNVDHYQLRGVFNQTEMMKLRWPNTGPGNYNLNARSHVGVTWQSHDIVTLY